MTPETKARWATIITQHRHRKTTTAWIVDQLAAVLDDAPTPPAEVSIVDVALSPALEELREIIPTLAASDLWVLTNPPVVGIVQALKRPCDACGHQPTLYPGGDAPRGSQGPHSEDQEDAA